MIYGIGCDLCSTARMAKSLGGAHGPAFAARVFGPSEREALGLAGAIPDPLSAHKAASAAADFAAKEAFLKAAAGNIAAAPALTPLLSAADNDIPDSLRARTPSWPIQLRLLPPQAPFLSGAHVLLAAQCSGFVLPGLHTDWLQGRIPVIACPKLDNNGDYAERLARLFAMRPASVTLQLFVIYH